METAAIQEKCEQGQRALSETDYIEAERRLAEAEEWAWMARDYDTLSRLYMPLQEARRQRRQRCGEGEVRLDLWAENPTDVVDGRRVVENYPQGQLLVAGWGSIRPAVEVRRQQRAQGLYMETFLGAVYPTSDGEVIVVAPTELTPMPSAEVRSEAALSALLAPGCLVLRKEDLPRGAQRGDAGTYAIVMALWEQLHRPSLAAADAQMNPVARMEGYRKTIEVDYACELAHQKLSQVAREQLRARQSAE